MRNRRSSWLGSAQRRPLRVRPRLELLEDRSLPSVDLLSGFAGLDFTQANQAPYPTSAPPDSIAAVGPGTGDQGFIVAAVNSDLAIYTKNGATVLQQDLLQFFAPLSPSVGGIITDPIVAYDDESGRFFVGTLDIPDPFFFSDSYFLYAVSDSSDPTADVNGDGRAFSEMHRIRVHDDATGSFFGAFADYPRVGWNADAHVFTFNLFDGFLGDFQRVEVLEIDKSTVLDRNSATFQSYIIYGSNAHFTMAPATMHNSQPGDPMWFVEEGSYANGNGLNQIRLVKFDTALNTQTSDVHQYLLNVDPYVAGQYPPAATQPGGGLIETNDDRILNAEWRRLSDGSERLVASQTVGLAGDAEAHARWHAFDTAGATPTVVGQESLDPGPGIHTYFPSVAIRTDGSVGMTYMQSSSSEYMSMYVTARAAGASVMEPAVLAKAGDTVYTSTFGDNPYRAGDYSDVTVDPTDGTLWAVNEYAKSLSGASANWGTWIANFTLPATTVHDVAVTNVTAPSPVTQGNNVPVSVQVANQGTESETFNVTLISDNATPGDTSDDIPIGSWSVTLAAGASTTLNATWSTTGVHLGTHTLTATASAVPGETDLADNVRSTTVLVNPPVTGNPNDIYVWDIAFLSRIRGSKHDERILVTIRRDADADGVAEASDPVVSGASVTLTVTGRGTFSGKTDNTGVFRTNWILAFANGTYYAEVTNLTMTGLTWNKALDPVAANGDTDTDADNLPEQVHVISGPHVRTPPLPEVWFEGSEARRNLLDVPAYIWPGALRKHRGFIRGSF